MCYIQCIALLSIVMCLRDMSSCGFCSEVVHRVNCAETRRVNAFKASSDSLNLLIAVPDDVFAPSYAWRGSFEYKGVKQPMTLTITSFNATSGKVNVTLTNRHSELLLSGKKLVSLTLMYNLSC